MNDLSSASGPDGPAPGPVILRITMAYDGTDFHGWQVQPGGLRTVQGEVAGALRRLVPLAGLPPGAGRTDAGVHARGQVSSVAVADLAAAARVRRALPRMMPPDVAIREVTLAPGGFHARFSATGRRYRYRLCAEPDPFLRRDHLLVRGDLDVAAMQAALRPLPGEHDCASLCRTASVEPGRTLCRIRTARFEWAGGVGYLELEADRFLHSMVRIIMGTLLEVGRQARDVDTFCAVLASGDRRQAGPTAPPHGLCLEEVFYDRSASAGQEP